MQALWRRRNAGMKRQRLEVDALRVTTRGVLQRKRRMGSTGRHALGGAGAQWSPTGPGRELRAGTECAWRSSCDGNAKCAVAEGDCRAQAQWQREQQWVHPYSL